MGKYTSNKEFAKNIVKVGVAIILAVASGKVGQDGLNGLKKCRTAA